MREKERCFSVKKSKRPFACRFRPGSGLGLGVVLAPRETRTAHPRRAHGGAGSRGPPGREPARVALTSLHFECTILKYF